MATFIIDCPSCKAKVGANQSGSIEETRFIDEIGEPLGEKLVIGKCPSCKTLLAGYLTQLEFRGWEGAEEDRWSDVTRVFPSPSKSFSSDRIPKTLTSSLFEADKTMQAGASMAAVVMFGRALEALCRDALKASEDTEQKRIMLGQGIKKLKDKRIIDDRLYNWSQELQVLRNLAAHPSEITVSRQDAEDMQAFVHAITEYVYDLSDRYEQFKNRKRK